MVNVEGAFGDEYDFRAVKHAEFLGKHGLGLSARWVILDTKEENIDALKKIDDVTRLNAEITRLRERGILRHVTELSEQELSRYAEILDRCKVPVIDIGSGIGKDNLGDPDYESKTDVKVQGTIRAAKALKTRRARIFNGYPRDSSRQQMDYREAVDISLRISDKVADAFKIERMAGFFENETELIGDTGPAVAEYHKMLNRANMLLLYDGANLVRIDKERMDLAWLSFLTMLKQGLAQFHLKDCPYFKLADEVEVKHAQYPHVAIGKGKGAYNRIFPYLVNLEHLSVLENRLEAADLSRQIAFIHEPHRVWQSNVGGITWDKFYNQLSSARAQYAKAGMEFQKFKPETSK